MIETLESWIRRVRRRISRSDFSLRLLGLSVEKGAETEPGLLLIQIDGLSRPQLEKAIAHRRMPFLHSLLRREKYELHTHYSGLPSSTPAVQAELFYGLKTAVPAFSFYKREEGEVMRMFSPKAAIQVERDLAELGGEPLLAGGSSYANIYGGGGAESYFCSRDLGWGRAKEAPSRWRVVAVVALNAFSFIRMLGLMVVEFFLAWFDFFRGLAGGEDLWKELKFVPTRVGVSIGLREFIVAGASIDLARGLPVIHANFLGYDEQAHRRGPSSAFAHWTLLGIDGAIRRLYGEASRSQLRDYTVWIFSDHGQEETTGFERETGRSLREVVEEVFQHPVPESRVEEVAESGTEEAESHGGGFWRFPREAGHEGLKSGRASSGRIVITSMGPIGHVYDLGADSGLGRAELAERMVALGVPMVLFRNAEGKIEAVNRDGHFELPREGGAIFGLDHPFLEDVVEDLVHVVEHPRAGDFVLSGWIHGRRMISFSNENGAHAGPGREEVNGFLLLPPGTPILSSRGGYYRPGDLRAAALHHLQRRPLEVKAERSAVRPGRETLRVMTYNVHGCVGIDSRLSPARIARVIARHRADVIALQEVDVGRTRSGWVDQARVIADLLLMKFHFYPAFEIEDEKYGLAVLSHFPMRLVKSGALPGLKERPELEPRGAQWIALEVGERIIHLVNTHLGLRFRERRGQVEAILGRDWLGQLGEDAPLVICGDLNALPDSFVHKEICTGLQDVQAAVAEHRPLRTLYGRYPLGRIDHIFISSHFEAQQVEVPRSALTRVASDHLPVLVDLKMRGGE